MLKKIFERPETQLAEDRARLLRSKCKLPETWVVDDDSYGCTCGRCNRSRVAPYEEIQH